MSLHRYVTGKSKVYGVMGHPIAHTLSPLIHNSIAQALGHDLVYAPFHVYPLQLKKAIEGAYALGIQGINVTVPHKQAIIPFLTKVDDMAIQIGAVNTLKFTDEGYVGYNTDANGLLQSLASQGIQLKDKKIFIIGAGGAARAVAMMVANEKPSHIWITNRTEKKSEELVKKVQEYYPVSIEAVPWNQYETISNIDVCFQTTSIGMSPDRDHTPVSSLRFYNGIKVAVDLIYNPGETLFINQAKNAGCKIINGFGMLFYQAIKAYEIWNEIQVPREIQDQVMNEVWIDFSIENQLK